MFDNVIYILVITKVIYHDFLQVKFLLTLSIKATLINRYITDMQSAYYCIYGSISSVSLTDISSRMYMYV